jgi:tyrosyl-tRNA synthetase
MEIKDIDLSALGRTTEEIYSLNELRTKLAEHRPLRIKYGVDVTAPFLHIGHAVNLWMMRYLQEHGHKVVFLIGDFTTRIGDPTGKSQTRKVIDREEIERNAEEFIKQVGRVLLTNQDVFEIRRNSEWFDKMHVDEFMSLLSLVTHSKLIQRDMFQKRIQTGSEIYLHEMLYPILQGYDSVMLNSDLTIVGTDQLFNELMGRFFQEKFDQSPQIVMTTRITPGLDGVEKQSKSLGNYIAITDEARNMYGKIMSIPDHLIVPYLTVYTLVPIEVVQQLESGTSDGSLNPMEAKKLLARSLVERYYGAAVAETEEQWFKETFSQRVIPTDIPDVKVSEPLTPVELLQQCLPDSSKAAIRRLLQQGGVRLNDSKLSLSEEKMSIKEGDILKVGKRQWFKLVPD